MLSKMLLFFTVSVFFGTSYTALINPQDTKTVKIGSQVWMTKNLEVESFSSGTTIKQAKTKEEWEYAIKNHQPAWCYQWFDSFYGNKYGKIYNWYAVIDPKGLAPNGYHIPTIDEWIELYNFCGGAETANQNLKNTTGWIFFDSGKTWIHNGNNSSGFSGLPGGSFGLRYYLLEGLDGGWWSTSEDSPAKVWIFTLRGKDDSNYPTFYPAEKENGYYVRCLKN